MPVAPKTELTPSELSALRLVARAECFASLPETSLERILAALSTAETSRPAFINRLPLAPGLRQAGFVGAYELSPAGVARLAEEGGR